MDKELLWLRLKEALGILVTQKQQSKSIRFSEDELVYLIELIYEDGQKG